jgi:hypothetical protein
MPSNYGGSRTKSSMRRPRMRDRLELWPFDAKMSIVRKYEYSFTVYRRFWQGQLPLQASLENRKLHAKLARDVSSEDAASRCSKVGDVVQLVRTLPCHGRGREFESRRPRHFFSNTYRKRSIFAWAQKGTK